MSTGAGGDHGCMAVEEDLLDGFALVPVNGIDIGAQNPIITLMARRSFIAR